MWGVGLRAHSFADHRVSLISGISGVGIKAKRLRGELVKSNQGKGRRWLEALELTCRVRQIDISSRHSLGSHNALLNCLDWSGHWEDVDFNPGVVAGNRCYSGSHQIPSSKSVPRTERHKPLSFVCFFVAAPHPCPSNPQCHFGMFTLILTVLNRDRDYSTLYYHPCKGLYKGRASQCIVLQSPLHPKP